MEVLEQGSNGAIAGHTWTATGSAHAVRLALRGRTRLHGNARAFHGLLETAYTATQHNEGTVRMLQRGVRILGLCSNAVVPSLSLRGVLAVLLRR